jgi:hypothetical protein
VSFVNDRYAQNYQEEFGLNHAGTKVAFFDLESGKEPIEEKALRKTLREQYTVFLAEFPISSVKRVISKKWMGSLEKIDSPFYNLNSNYKYNIEWILQNMG